MKTVDPSLNTFLDLIIDLGTEEISFCELFTLTLTSGDVLRYTDWDADITIGGHTYIGTGTVIPQRGRTKSSVGFNVDDMQLDFLIGEDDSENLPLVLGGLTLQQLAACGFTDKADVLVQRLFWQTPGVIPPWNPVYKFGGTIARPTSITRSVVSYDVQSHMQRLQRQVPQTVMQPSCNFFHYGDERCGVSLAAFQVACSADVASTAVLLKCASALGSHQPDGYFDKGFVIFTSGKNKGLAQAIRESTQADGLFLCAPLLFPPQAGDTFEAAPGCDRTQGTSGCTKFSNIARYGGYPYVPAPETAI